jgi:large subunit ribosomal protein L4
MATIDILNQKGKKVGDTELEETVFAIEPNVHVMHEVVKAQLAGARAGTHQTKTRGNVRGGGKKPYRQKGTGRARQGSIRSPHYAGGGVVFGPHPRSYAQKVPAKVIKLAMRSALSAKLADAELKVVDDFKFEEPSTKGAVKALKDLKATGRITIFVADNDINAFLSFRNIPGVLILGASEMNTYDFIDNGTLIITVSALKYVQEVLA